jgi:large subunit ribosomal protein L32
MAVPKQRQTKSRRDKRRAHLKMKPVKLSKCPKCGEPILAHHYCSACGFYNGKEAFDVLAKLTKREKKRVQKEQQEKEKTQQKKGKGLNMGEMSKK